MRKITLGEFENVCEEVIRNREKIEFDIEDQEWYEPFGDPLYRIIFDRISICPNPKRVMFSSGGANMTLLFVDSIFESENKDTYDICCKTNVKKSYKIKLIKNTKDT